MAIVISKDGTKIAYDRFGSGPPVVLVDGALGFRAFGPSEELAKLLSPSFTGFCYDRRGRGQSTDTKPFSLAKEIQDIDALIDEAGGSAYLYGISSGGALALEAAIALGRKVKKIAVYEAPYDASAAGIENWKKYRQTLRDFIDANCPGDAVTLFMSFVGAPKEMIDGMKQSPVWKTFESVGPTLLYDAEALGPERKMDAARLSSINARTLIIVGSESAKTAPFMHNSAKFLVASIPGAGFKILEGQRHDVDSKVIAPVLAEFFKG